MRQHIHNLRAGTNRTITLLLAVVSVAIFSQSTIAFALPQNQRDLFEDGVYYYDYNQSMICSAVGVPAEKNSGSNTDYTGKQIINDAQFSAIAENQPTYQQAADEADIPWQLLAVTHLRESGLGRTNPGNGQGIYQFVSGHGGPYPAGPVDEAEFLRQTKLAAAFLKDKAAGANLQANRKLTADANPEVIKDTLFSYNGRSEQYANQAASIGYDKETQPYEGSPYVMNKADAKRDPAVNKTTWGQVKRDFGPIEYPANDGYGAFVVYAAIAGISIDNNCSNAINGTVRQKVVALAKQELDAWDSGKLKPGGDFTKYSGGARANWCAWFASWIYNQAGYPLDTRAKDGRVAAVTQIWEIGQAGQRFKFHSVNSDYTPKPGDLVIQKEGVSHVNIVVAVEGDTITVIGGNQGGSGNLNGYFMSSSVTQYQMNIHHEHNTGFVSPD